MIHAKDRTTECHCGAPVLPGGALCAYHSRVREPAPSGGTGELVADQVRGCHHCGGDHPAAAHEDALIALEEADRDARNGDTPGSRRWIAVAMNLVRRERNG